MLTNKHLAIVALIVAALCIACSSNSPSVNAKAASAAHESIPVDQYTQSPRRVSTRTRLDKSLAEVWEYLSDHNNLLEYSDGVLGNVTVDTTLADSDGVGVKRVCETADGSGRFVERVVYSEPPYAFAYVLSKNTWGLKDYLATVSLDPISESATIVQWDLYFDHVQPDMIPQMTMNMEGMMKGRMLPYLTRKFGGTIL
ncbi:MAG: SRPBCC family protein [Myxococcota bacterium]